MNPGQADTLGTMRATGWTKGQTHEPGGYGLKITAEDRDRHFDRAWGDIDVDLEGQGLTKIALTESFWRCTELRSADVGRWLLDSGRAPWPKGQPPMIALTPVEGTRFAARILRQHNLL